MSRTRLTSALPPVVAQELRQLLGERLLDDPLSLHLYSYDAAMDTALPAAVALPQTAEEVAAAVRICRRQGVPVVARGAGTSLCGGPIPPPGALVLSLARMNRVLDLAPQNGWAVVQPGLVNLDLQRRLAPLGYFYAPDPASQQASTLGGNLGHNAGGPHCLKYGVTANHLLGLEMVTAQGERVRLGGPGGEAPGYNLLALVVGGEGTLGIATEVTCRILPLPEASATVLGLYASLEEACQTVSALIAAGLIPAALELMDQPLMEAVERTLKVGYPPGAAAILLMDVDGPAETIGPQLAAIERVARAQGAREVQVAEREVDRELLWRGRRGVAAAIANLAPGKQSTDVVVPRDRLPQMMRQVVEIGRKYDLLVGSMAHAGDGNLHPQIIFDQRDPDQVRRLLAAQEEIVRAALALGGGMTGEHGVGTEKRRFMPLMFGPAELDLMWRLRRAFDPEELLNPGKLLPDPLPPTGAPLGLPEGAFAPAAEALAVRDDQGRLCPYDYEAVGKLLALARRKGQRVRLVGSGTSSLPPGPQEQVITLTGLRRVLEVQAANMTVACQAGVRLAELQAALAEAGQWWPVAPPGGAQATVGGVLAAGRAGLYALRYGRLPDLLTGVVLALPSGEVVRFGIPCVKNVAGYALERLMVGSRGTLAALVEVTLRTLPRPAAQRTWRWTLPSMEGAEALVRALLAARVRPAALAALSPGAAPGGAQGDGWLVTATWQGLTEEVGAAQAVLPAAASADRVDDSEQAAWWATLADQPRVWALAGPAVEVVCAPSRWAQVAGALSALGPCDASPALGTVRVRLAVSAEEARETVQQEAAAAEGFARWLPPSEGPQLARMTPALRELHQRVKAACDPEGVLPSLPELLE